MNVMYILVHILVFIVLILIRLHDCVMKRRSHTVTGLNLIVKVGYQDTYLYQEL
jgi:hypothetical protein